MSRDPLVSIVIDNYGYGRFLRAAVCSALEQSYGAVEVIVVDDGSLDNSREILREFGHAIRAVLKPNGGQASAFNAGLAECRGEVVCLLDADDVWDRDKVAEVVSAVRSRAAEGWAMLRHNLRVQTDGPQQMATAPDAVVPGIRQAFLCENIAEEDVLIRRRNAPSSAIAFPMAAWNACGPVRPEEAFRISADAYLYTHLPRFGKVVSLSATLGSYRVHGSNNYFASHPTSQQLAAVAELEFNLLDTLPRTVRLHDTLLMLAHSESGRQGDYLRTLGSLPRRVSRVIGRPREAILRVDVARTVCREVLRTVLT